MGDDCIDIVILDIGMGHGTSIWEMTISTLSSWISIWDISSLCLRERRRDVLGERRSAVHRRVVGALTLMVKVHFESDQYRFN